MIELNTIGHVHLKVTDLKRSVKFYTEALGFRVTERVANFVFLTVSNRHHDLALQEVGHHAPRPAPHAIGLFHFAFELPDLRALADAYVRLREADVRITGAVDYGISKTIYFSDPDGNGLEFYVDTRHERPKWGGISHPLDLEALLALRQSEDNGKLEAC
jgi:catechol 2,3-dioxygenase